MIDNYLLNYKGRSCILIGRPGIGKTTLIQAKANDLDYELEDVNASEKRSVKSLDNLENFVKNDFSFTYKGKMVLLDEIDEANTRYIDKLKKIVKKSNVPIFLVANALTKEVYPLYKDCEYSCFVYPPKNKKIKQYLMLVSKKLGLDITEREIMKIVYNNDGDIRNMLNILEKRRFCDDNECIGNPNNFMSNYEITRELLTNRNFDYLRRIGEVIPDNKRRNIKYWLLSTLIHSSEGETLKDCVDTIYDIDRLQRFIWNEERYDLLKYLNCFLSFNCHIETYFSKYGNIENAQMFFNKREVSGTSNINTDLESSEYVKMKKKKNVEMKKEKNKIVF